MDFNLIYAPEKWLACKRQASLCALTALFFVFLGGCVTTVQEGRRIENSLEFLITDAERELTGGNSDKALSLLNRAAKEHPASPGPWLQMANIWFDKGNYPSSILAANEVLLRDPANQDAKGILVVAGLRVAADAVAGLRPNGSANMNAWVEAENLTTSLRSVLGEKNLVPQTEIKQTNSPSRSKARPGQKISSRTSSPVRSSGQGAGATDPFKSLK